MVKSELITALAKKLPQLERKDVELAVACIIDQIGETLTSNERVEIRGFGSFSLHYHPPMTGRNPRTGEKLDIPGRYSAYFKPGKELRKRVNEQQSDQDTK